MSSARANASARNRRAGGNEMPPPQQMMGRPGQPGQPMQPPPKLSVSDAIALITLRLGRVEQIVSNMPVDGQHNLSPDGEDIKIVDNSVFENVMQRLDSLEKGQKVLATTPSQVVQSNSSAQVSDELTETVEILKEEVSQLKDLLLNLQAFTMQTNHRLSEIVFNGSSENEELILSGNVVCETASNNETTEIQSLQETSS
jgi:hypothetical protein